MSRNLPRRLVCILSLVLLASCGGGPGAGGPEPRALYIGGPAATPNGTYDYNLTIVYSNDIHAQILPDAKGLGGVARHGTYMRLLREQAAARGVGLLAANAGDNFEGTLFYDVFRGAFLFQVLEALGYDVVQVGNHDHQFGVQILYDVLAAAFPGFQQELRVLWGNVNPSGLQPTGTPPTPTSGGWTPATVSPEAIQAFENAFTAWDPAPGGVLSVDAALMDPPLSNAHLLNQTLWFDVNGIRVGIFGIDTDEAFYASVPGEGQLFANPEGRAENLRFYSPTETTWARDMVAYLEDPDSDPQTDDGADVIVAVTHLGPSSDIPVAQAAVTPSGRHIDVIVGGHSHDRINRAITVDHPGGGTTWIVQAGELGEFLGRIDLFVDPNTDTVSLRNVELLQVDENVPEDPAIAALITQPLAGPGGVNESFGFPYATQVASAAAPLSYVSGAAFPLGGLATDACLAVGNQPPYGLGLDAMMLGSFVFRQGLPAGPLSIADVHDILPLHVLDRDGGNPDTVHWVDLPGGLWNGIDPGAFPSIQYLTGITTLEYLLEVIFSVDDVLAFLEQLLGFSIGSVGEYISGFQWAGLDFVVDTEAPPGHRIEPGTIFVNGLPLLGNEQLTWRVGINGILARFAFPFLQFLVWIEDPLAPGIPIPFPPYSETANDSGVPVWVLLRDHIDALEVLQGDLLRVTGERPRTLAPDLSFNPVDAVLSPPSGTPGGTVQITLPILNLGLIPATDALAMATFDPTPDVITDNPDGFTDVWTGFAFPLVGSVATGPVPGSVGPLPGTTDVVFQFQIPAGAAPGLYPVYVSLSGVVSSVPTQPETVTANNGGRAYAILVPVQ